jgi:hypothetical protein
MGAPEIPPLRCGECKHYLDLRALPNQDSDLEPEVVVHCVAFPDGIPTAIREGRFDHIKPFAGDHGIQFEPLTG